MKKVTYRIMKAYAGFKERTDVPHEENIAYQADYIRDIFEKACEYAGADVQDVPIDGVIKRLLGDNREAIFNVLRTRIADGYASFVAEAFMKILEEEQE